MESRMSVSNESDTQIMQMMTGRDFFLFTFRSTLFWSYVNKRNKNIYI